MERDNRAVSGSSSAGIRRSLHDPAMAHHIAASDGSGPGLHRTERDPTMLPKLFCGCQRTVVARTARTDKNYGRRFLTCQLCKLFIWEDLLNRYAEDMVFYCQAPVIDELKAEVNNARQLLMQKDALIASLEAELTKYSGVSQDVDRCSHQDEASERPSRYNCRMISIAFLCAALFVKALVSASRKEKNEVLALG